MNFQEFNSYLAPVGLILAGIIIKFSNNNELFGSLKKRWYVFFILGLLLLILKIVKI